MGEHTYAEDWIERCHRFAVRVLKMANALPRAPAGIAMAYQVAKSGPSIVHNLEEAKGASTLPDTHNKTVIARKEARECRRSILLIRDAELLPAARLTWLLDEGDPIVAMLTKGAKRLEARIGDETARRRALRRRPAAAMEAGR